MARRHLVDAGLAQVELLRPRRGLPGRVAACAANDRAASMLRSPQLRTGTTTLPGSLSRLLQPPHLLSGPENTILRFHTAISPAFFTRHLRPLQGSLPLSSMPRSFCRGLLPRACTPAPPLTLQPIGPAQPCVISFEKDAYFHPSGHNYTGCVSFYAAQRGIGEAST